MTDNASRHNAGKLDLTILPVKALRAEAEVWSFGEQKYGRDNWKKLWGDNTINVVMASMMRHCLAILDGEVTDPESNLAHAAHIRANAAMLIEYESQRSKVEPTPWRIKLEYKG